jgi:hypothetical protein
MKNIYSNSLAWVKYVCKEKVKKKAMGKGEWHFGNREKIDVALMP